MAMELRVPALGESVREATLGAWKHVEGDEVAVDEPLVEVESEKATVEVPSPGAGILRKILRKAGDTVAVGEVIAEIEQLGRAPGQAELSGERTQGRQRQRGQRQRGQRQRSSSSAGGRAGCAVGAARAGRQRPFRRGGQGQRPRGADLQARRRARARGAGQARFARSAPEAPGSSAAADARPRRRWSTSRASASSRCRRCARRSPTGWSRPSTPPRCSPRSTRSTCRP